MQILIGCLVLLVFSSLVSQHPYADFSGPVCINTLPSPPRSLDTTLSLKAAIQAMADASFGDIVE